MRIVGKEVEVTVRLRFDRLRLLVDMGDNTRLLSIDGRGLSVLLTEAEWLELELAGVDVPFNCNRLQPFFGPKEFCVTPTGMRNVHGTYVTRGLDGRGLCAFCSRPTGTSPSDPEGKLCRAPQTKAARRRKS